MAPLPPITLEPPGPREVVDEDKAKEFVKLWTEQLLQHQSANSITDENNNNDADGTKNNIILCQRIRLSDKSYTAEAAAVIATFLTEPFVGSGIPLVHDIVEVDLSDSIAGRMTEEGLQVLKTICDAFVESKLVDVNLSDNAIGQQGIGACRTALSKKSLERLALCNNGLSRETMRQVADILTNNDDDDGTGCIASNMTKIHFYNNMSGEDG
jgi:Ran GTPase-activating protein 1